MWDDVRLGGVRKEDEAREGECIYKTRNNERKRCRERIEEERDTDEPKGEQVQTWPVRKSLTARGQKLPEGLVRVWKQH